MQDAIGFDNDKYLQEQSAAILERVGRFGNKLYLEFGGKLLFDYHAARVLPGFDPNVKMRLLAKLKEQGRDPAVHPRRGHRAEEDAGRLRHHLRRRRHEVDRRPARVGHRAAGRRDHPVRRPARGRAVQEQARTPRHPGLHPPPDQGLPDGRRSDRQHRRLRRQSVHRDRKAAGGGHRPRPGQRQAGHLPEPDVPRPPPRHPLRATPSSRPFPSGTCR